MVQNKLTLTYEPDEVFRALGKMTIHLGDIKFPVPFSKEIFQKLDAEIRRLQACEQALHVVASDVKGLVTYLGSHTQPTPLTVLPAPAVPTATDLDIAEMNMTPRLPAGFSLDRLGEEWDKSGRQ